MRSKASQLKHSVTLAVRSFFFRIVLSEGIVSLLDRRRSETGLGPRGELAAERFLLRQGYWIVDRGVGEKTGEIDLIVSDARDLIFVEVKTRSSDAAGDPSDAVDAQKQIHISQTARLFAVRKGVEDCSLRFDVISILWPDDQKSPTIKHYRNAFEAAGDFQMF